MAFIRLLATTYLILTFFTAPTAISFSCKQLFRSAFPKQSMQVDKKEWETFIFSEPAIHNSESFTYVVHSLIPVQIFLQNKTDLISAILNLENPHYIVSASVVTNKSKNLYGSGIGVILRVPSSNLISAGFGDLGIDNSKGNDLNYVVRKYSEEGLLSPYEIANQIAINTEPSVTMNEVNFNTIGPYGEKIGIDGIVINQSWINAFPIDPLTGISYSELVDTLLKFAKSKNLPVVTIN